MNRSRLLLMLLGLFFSFISLSAQEVWDGSVAQSFAGGTGTQDDPYLISCAEELAYLSKLTKETPSKTSGTYYKLIGNIILNEEVLTDSYQLKGTPKNIWTPIGESENTTGHYDTAKSFMGYFDGGGHVVSGVYCPTSYQIKGLFGTITGEVHDLNVIDSYVSTGRISGAVVGGVARSAKLYRCYAEALTEGSEFGGLVVGHVEGLVEHCYSTGRVQSNTNGGGIAGWLNYGTARNCFSVFYGGNGTIGGSGNNGTQSNMYYDRTVDGSKNNGIAKTTDEMQSNDFIELLGSPFEAMDGEYPFIPGLLLVGEGTSYSSTAFRLNIGKLTNGIGTKIRFYREYDGTNLRSAISRSEIGETVYVKLNIRRRMLLTEGSLVLTNDTTGQSIPLTAIADNIWSFTMPESTVTLTAAFHVDPNVPKVWDGTVSETFAGGSGTQEDPYLIASGEDLALLAQITNENKGKTKGVYYKQTADIYLNESLLDENFELIVTPENMWTPIADCSYSGRFAFQGDYDGNGHVISGLYYVTEVSQHYAGLFGIIGDDASIHDLAVVDAYVSCRYSGGLLVGGVSNNASVRRCYASGLTEGSGGYMGLLTGGIDQKSKVIIEHCYASGINNSAGSRGGLLGTTSSGTIRNCFTVARVNHGSGRRGAIVGYVQNTNAQFSYLFYDKTVETTLKALEDENTTTCYGLTTEVMQSDKLAELLGEPFEFADGNYPYIPGLPRVGEYTAYFPAGHHLTVGTLTNSKGSSVGFYETYENSDAKKRINYAEAGQTVYLKVNLYRNMQIAEGTLVVTNDATGKSVAVTNVSDGIWSFTMPESTVTVSASFIRDTSLPAIWDGTVANAFAEGDGSEDDPYLIHDGEELAYLAQLCNANSTLTKGKYFQLANDIILNEDVLSNDFEVNDPVVPYNLWTPIGKDQSHSFQGYFNGNNHFISGAYVDGGAVTGLFGYVNGGSIRNLSFIDSYIVGTYPAMVSNLAVSDSSWVSNCYVEACSKGTSNSTSYYTSHIVSVLGAKGTVENCYASGLATGYGTKAAIVGNQTGAAVVRNCFSNVKGATSIGGVKNYNTMDNIYNDLDLGVTMGNAKDTYCSKHTIEMQTTDFAELIGEPFVYTLGNYPHIPGLQKIGENRGWTTPKDPTHGGAGEIWDGEASIIFASGTGTEADPYIINNGAQLKYLAKLTNANGKLTKGRYYRLEADIVLNDTVLTEDYELRGEPANIWEPIGAEKNSSFQGVLDGNNYIISGLYINNTSSYQALFGYVDGTIRDLQITDSYVKCYNYPAALVSMLAQNDSSLISHCFVDAHVECAASGGYYSNYYASALVNTLGAKGIIEYCYTNGLLTNAGNLAGLVCTQTNGGVIRNSYTVAKGGRAVNIVGSNIYISNVYYSRERAGESQASQVKEDFRSAEDVEMLSTDFAAMLGEPYEYSLGYYPYIYGLPKINEKGKTVILNGYPLNLGTIINGSDCHLEFYRTYAKKTKELSHEVIPGSKVMVDGTIALYAKVTSSAAKRLSDEGLVVVTDAGETVSVTEIADNVYEFTMTKSALSVSAKFVLGGYCGNPEENNGRNMRWQLSDDNSTLIIAGTGNMYSKPWTTYANNINAIEVNEGVTSVMDEAFKGMNKVTTATLAATLETIGTEAFSGCSATVDLSTCTLLTALHANEFSGFAGTVYLPESVTTIEIDAFAGTYASVQHVYSPVADGKTLFANDVQVPDVEGMGDIVRYGITDNQEVRLVWSTGYLVTTIANSDGILKVYADEALNKEIPAGYKAVRTDDQTRIYVKVEPKNTKILFLNGLTVKAGSSMLATTQESDEVFSFLMPTEAVTISAQFATGGYCGITTVNNGHNLIWTLDNGTLAFQKNVMSISDDTTMDSWTTGKAPWNVLGNSVKEVDLSGVKNIGSNAFSSCTDLIGVELPATPILTVGDNAFTQQMVLIVPAESWGVYEQTAGWSAYAEQMARDKEMLTLTDGLQWRTYYSKVGRLLPEGVKAYTITSIGNTEVVISQAMDYIPAGQPVLIENSERKGRTEDITTSLQPYSAQDDTPVCRLTANEDNLLQWISVPIPVNAGDGYTLYKDEFVKVSSGTLPAGIAFLPSLGVSASRLGITGGDVVTGIDSVNDGQSMMDEGEWFTLDGKKLSGRPARKGVYVKDGQKVVIK